MFENVVEVNATNFRDKFSSLKWWLADHLSRWSIRLRGQKVYSTILRVEGNEAAELADDIRFELAVPRAALPETFEHLDRLEQLAGATWHHEFHSDLKEQVK